jgi:fatty-acid desaturase
MAIEGPVIRWVADHRRHHAFSDKEGDPHSPWRYGENFPALVKGLFHAHVGWLFDVEQTDQKRFAPDLLADRDVHRVHRLFPVLTLISLLLPGVIGGLWGGSWQAAAQAFFWAGLVRIATLHHVTWSINSICHTFGKRPFKSRDRSANVWPLAIISMGESWHNLHHADPTCARHGVLRGQVDTSAEIIRGMEKLGWVWDVRWPDPKRLDGGGQRSGSADSPPPEMIRAPGAGPVACRTARHSPEDSSAAATVSAAAADSTRKAQVGPEPLTKAPRAPASEPVVSTARRAGRSRSAGSCRSLLIAAPNAAGSSARRALSTASGRTVAAGRRRSGSCGSSSSIRSYSA